jgi:molybdopterin synthase sulfur carrier subunit
MKVTLKLFASLAIHLPAEARSLHRLELEVEPGTTVLDLILKQGVPPGQCSLVLVDGVWVSPSERGARVLSEGEVLAIWPPVAGG